MFSPVPPKSFDKKWFEFEPELKRRFADQTWIPLRMSRDRQTGDSATKPPYNSECWAVGTVAFPPENISMAEEMDWSDLGTGHEANSYAYRDGYYKRSDEFQHNDKETVGTNLVLVQRGTRTRKEVWHINQDLIMALDLVKEGNNWVSPSQDFDVVIKEEFSEDGSFSAIEIKKSYLLDYLSARNLNLRFASYRQRVLVASKLFETPYPSAITVEETRNGARFELRVRTLQEIYGGTAAVLKVWRTNFDSDLDAPKLGPETDENTDSHSYTTKMQAQSGFRVEGEFWLNEWLMHNGRSEIVRGDKPTDFPKFITESSEPAISSDKLNNEDIGKWLWFKPTVVKDFLRRRDFSLKWYTEDTAGLFSPNGYRTHFGLNKVNLVVAYAYDIARLPIWEQRVWSAHNCEPEGGLGAELEAAQIRTTPAKTLAPEDKLQRVCINLELAFIKTTKVSCFQETNKMIQSLSKFSRFGVLNDDDLLSLSKEIYRAIFENLDLSALRKNTNVSNEKIGSIKLFATIIERSVGKDKAREITAPLAGLYDLRIGDAHKTSSKIEDAFSLTKIDRKQPHIQQAKELIDNVSFSIYNIANIVVEQAAP